MWLTSAEACGWRNISCGEERWRGSGAGGAGAVKEARCVLIRSSSSHSVSPPIWFSRIMFKPLKHGFGNSSHIITTHIHTHSSLTYYITGPVPFLTLKYMNFPFFIFWNIQKYLFKSQIWKPCWITNELMNYYTHNTFHFPKYEHIYIDI